MNITIRKFQPRRFAMGFLCTAAGVALILGVGLRVIEMRNVGGDFTTTLIGICVLIGVMLLVGGFGVMATSSSGFDEDEFDRLATAGNISAVSQPERSDNAYGEDQDAHHAADALDPPGNFVPLCGQQTCDPRTPPERRVLAAKTHTSHKSRHRADGGSTRLVTGD